jgi:hypothetical protein
MKTAYIFTAEDGVHELDLPAADKVEGSEIEVIRQPSTGDLEEGAGVVAAKVVALLDTQYNREQVHQILKWAHFLSTQA